MNKDEFYTYINKLGISIDDNQKKLLEKYAEFLIEYNKNVNLTAIKTENEVYLKHFYDSILLLKYYKLTNEKVLDIGTGAGFPGVILKIMCPNIDLTLLESNGKKTTFLNKLKPVLNIDYQVVNDRAENFIKNKREFYDVVTSRAVTSMPALVELSIPFVKVEGVFLPYKGKIDDTLENGNYAIGELGAKVEEIYHDKLPKEEADRTFLIIRKSCKSNSKYPRHYDKIIKKPLQNKIY